MLKDIIRIFIFLFIGAFLLFFIQKSIYNSGSYFFFRLSTNPSLWITKQYIPSANLLFISSIITNLVWFFLTFRIRASKIGENLQLNVHWWFLYFSLETIALLLVFFVNKDPFSYFSLFICFTIDILFLFWLPTATASQGIYKFIPPGSLFLRSLLGDR